MNEDPRIAELTAELLAALARFTGRLKAEHEDFLATHRLVDAKGAAELLDVKLSWVREKTPGPGSWPTYAPRHGRRASIGVLTALCRRTSGTILI